MLKNKVRFSLLFFLSLFIAFPLLAEVSQTDSRFEAVPVLTVLLLLLFAGFYYYKPFLEAKGKASQKPIICLIFGLAFFIRLLMALKCMGHTTDIGSLTGWAINMANIGPKEFYPSMTYASYPPGYMLLLWPIGKLLTAIPTLYESSLYTLLIKLPVMICDLLIGWILYHYSTKKGFKAPLFYASLFLFNPAVIFSSSIWGQVDAAMGLFLILMILALVEKKLVAACLCFTLGLLIKPLMLLSLPILLIGYVFYCFRTQVGTILRSTLLGVLSSLFLLVLVSLPFGEVTPLWMTHFYTALLDQYASVNAINLLCLLGGAWKPATETLFFTTYKIVGLIGLTLTLGFTCLLAYEDKSKQHLALCGSVCLVGIFTFAYGIHENYLFMGIICLILAYMYEPSRMLLGYTCFFSVLHTLNLSLVLYKTYIYGNQISTMILCLLNLMGFFLLSYFAYCVATEHFEEAPLKEKVTSKEALSPKAFLEERLKLKVGQMTRKDWLICLSLTFLYALFAFYNLGSTTGPTTIWEPAQGESVTVDLGSVQTLSELRFYPTVTSKEAKLLVTTSLDGVNWEPSAEVLFDDETGHINHINCVYKWISVAEVNGPARFLKLTSTGDTLRILEVALMGEDHLPLALEVTEATGPTGQNAFDEQALIPADPTYLNESHFDEIYHARTAWEHLVGLEPYENTHPPLGKDLISLGIMIFGMVPFGWRFMGTLFGVLMLPCLYVFGKTLFKKTRYALITLLLMSFDFMHYTQTRIATIDTYIVFFMILMYYFMYLFYQTNYLIENKKLMRKSLLYLALSGIFFGLASASKWTGIYAGGGLAVIFFYSLSLRFQDYHLLKAHPSLKEELPTYEEALKAYPKRTLAILIWCCLFFVAIPITIYIASYWPQISKLGYGPKELWHAQTHMFNYHSQLKAEHSFASPWYKWPLMIRPIWYYYKAYNDQTMNTISSFGNPAVWWVGFVAILALFFKAFKGKRGNTALFISLGFLAELLPWTLVTRCTFIYHYFPCVPFIILSIVWWIKYFETHSLNLKRTKTYVTLYVALAAALLIIYYPIISGFRVSNAYVKALQLLSTWYFGVS